MIEIDFLNKLMSKETGIQEMKEVNLNLGMVKIYDFGKIKVYAYISNDALYDVSYVIEKGDNLVLIESGAFKENNKEFHNYIVSLKKTVSGQLMAYHPNGQNDYEDSIVYATENAVENWGENGSIKALTDGFVASFGDVIEDKMPQKVEIIKTGEKINVGGIDFNILETGDDAYSIEIPEINCIYRHMMGSKCHSIIPNPTFIDTEGIEAVTEKINYLEKTKMIVENSKTSAEFIEKMKRTFYEYTGENYLEMTAGMLFN